MPRREKMDISRQRQISAIGSALTLHTLVCFIMGDKKTDLDAIDKTMKIHLALS